MKEQLETALIFVGSIALLLAAIFGAIKAEAVIEQRGYDARSAEVAGQLADAKTVSQDFATAISAIRDVKSGSGFGQYYDPMDKECHVRTDWFVTPDNLVDGHITVGENTYEFVRDAGGKIVNVKLIPAVHAAVLTFTQQGKGG